MKQKKIMKKKETNRDTIDTNIILFKKDDDFLTNYVKIVNEYVDDSEKIKKADVIAKALLLLRENIDVEGQEVTADITGLLNIIRSLERNVEEIIKELTELRERIEEIKKEFESLERKQIIKKIKDTSWKKDVS